MRALFDRFGAMVWVAGCLLGNTNRIDGQPAPPPPPCERGYTGPAGAVSAECPTVSSHVLDSDGVLRARAVAAVSAVHRGQVQGSNWLGAVQSLCCWPVRREWSNVQPVLRALRRGAVLNSRHSCWTRRERLHRLLGWTVRRGRWNDQPVFWTMRSRAIW